MGVFAHPEICSRSERDWKLAEHFPVEVNASHVTSRSMPRKVRCARSSCSGRVRVRIRLLGKPWNYCSMKVLFPQSLQSTWLK